jgi:hypothetical protein
MSLTIANNLLAPNIRARPKDTPMNKNNNNNLE